MASGSSAPHGDMDSVGAVGNRLSRLNQLNGTIAQLGAGILQVHAAGNAAALTNLVLACQPIETHARHIARTRMIVGRAPAAYASEVRELQYEARRLLARKSRAQSRKLSVLQAIGGVVQDAPGSTGRMRTLGVQAEHASEELQQIERALAECDQARLRAGRQRFTGLPGQCGAIRSSRNSEPESAVAGLFIRELTPGKAAEIWSGLGMARDDVEKLPITLLLKLANVDGVPAWARDIASQAALKYAISSPAVAYIFMGFSGSGSSLRDFSRRLGALQKALTKAKTDRLNLPGAPKVQMVGLGNHDGAITTAISFGDVDTASHIAVNAPGIGSTVDRSIRIGTSSRSLGFTCESARIPRPNYTTAARLTPVVHTTPPLRFERGRCSQLGNGTVATARCAAGGQDSSSSSNSAPSSARRASRNVCKYCITMRLRFDNGFGKGLPVNVAVCCVTFR